ncbi:FG-GAP repeat protein [Candidatus Villigracilis proximus]|uniref:FG-GAP repeat protein n=1 Tax=Candidatus Villigracilis proximus TaxID=3140683 RepID=UPI0031EB646D
MTLFALLISLLGSAAAFSPAHAALPANLPTGLTAADWSQIEALLPPTQQTYIKASNTEANDSFGISMALSGDTLVVGAIFEDSNATGVNGNQANNSATDSGAAYVFTRNGTTWSQQAYLKASNTNPNDWFGASVAISGDTLVVGAFFEDSNATGINGNQADNSASESGAAYVFTRNGTTWSQQAYLKASNTDPNDWFGYSAAISGDTLVVGVFKEDSNVIGVNGNQLDNSATDSGAAYVFTRNGTNWSQQAYLKASNTEAIDDFGNSVAISGDTLVVGALNESSNATGVNGNQADNSASYSGAAYVFTRNGTTWSQQAYLKASNTDPNDWFGYSVAISGDTLVVGSRLKTAMPLA